MKCMHPLAVVLDNKKAGERKRQFVPCGKCNFCLQVRRAHWTFRLRMELKESVSAHFLTLTYDDDHLICSPSGLPTISKRDMQLFTKRLRKEQASYGDNSIRYYSVGEYGTITSRPHYHSIMFNCLDSVIAQLPMIWGKGQVMVGSVTPASIHYVAKYHVNKIGEYGDRAPPFCINVSKARYRRELHRDSCALAC